MKHKLFRILLTVLIGMVANISSAHDFEVNGIYYVINDRANSSTVSVSYKGNNCNSYSDEYSGTVIIPRVVMT
jgi:hypothetical protein